MDGVKPMIASLNEMTPKSPKTVVVEPYAVVVPYSKPRTVAFDPPVLVILPFNVAEDEVTPDAGDVVTLGLEGVTKLKTDQST